ncbi:ferric iron reductase [Salinisphaera sp. C84B14]|uniref:siderophore-iron reductase FhuF n=1 Tax=Salinisphaera sp. C84B14 TaxID=1304155 RepID=UPI003340CE3E
MFADHFHDDLASFSDVLLRAEAAPSAATIEAVALTDPARLDPLLTHFGERHECTEPRARASQWSKYFFARLGIATLVAQLASDRALDFDLNSMRVVCDDDGTAAQFLFATGSAPVSDRPGHDFSALVDDAFAPVIATLSQHCRLSTRVFWSNAGVYFDWALGELERQQRIPPERLAAVRALMTCRQRPEGGFNPFNRIHKRCPPGTLDGNGEPVEQCRRLCCMRDLDSRWDLCSNCPRAMHRAEPDRATG